MRAAWRAMRLWNGQLKVTSGGAQQGKDPGSEILFFGTADLSGRCKTRQDGKLTDEVVSCKKNKEQAPLQLPKKFNQVRAHCLRLLRPGFTSCSRDGHTNSRIDHSTNG